MLLSISNLRKSFSNTPLIDGFSLELEKGQNIAIIGDNGVGKSTFFDLITAEKPCDSGEIFFNQKKINHLSCDQIARLGIARKYQFPIIYPDLTILENIRLACYRSNIKAGGHVLKDLMLRAGFNQQNHVKAKNLSFGQCQWLEIAMVMAVAPKILLLDEPTIGIDREEELCLWIKEYQQAGGAILIISHHIPFLKKLNCLMISLPSPRKTK